MIEDWLLQQLVSVYYLQECKNLTKTIEISFMVLWTSGQSRAELANNFPLGYSPQETWQKSAAMDASATCWSGLLLQENTKQQANGESLSCLMVRKIRNCPSLQDLARKTVWSNRDVDFAGRNTLSKVQSRLMWRKSVATLIKMLKRWDLQG